VGGEAASRPQAGDLRSDELLVSDELLADDLLADELLTDKLKITFVPAPSGTPRRAMESIGVEALWPPNDSGFEAHAAAGAKRQCPSSA
jgi:hypothetical protein